MRSASCVLLVLSSTGLLLGTGCDGACEVEGGPALELGSGELEFESLVDQGKVTIVFGPQGGYHLVGSFRTRGIEPGDSENLADPSNPTGRFSVVHEGQEMVLSSPFTQGLRPVESCDGSWSHQVLNRRAVLDVASDDELSGEEVTFSLELTTASGDVFTDQRELTVVPHPLND